MQFHSKQFSNEAAFIFVISNPWQTDISVTYSKRDLGIAGKAIILGSRGHVWLLSAFGRSLCISVLVLSETSESPCGDQASHHTSSLADLKDVHFMN